MDWHDQKREGASISLLACYLNLLSSSMLIEYYVRLLKSDEYMHELYRSADFAKEKVEHHSHAMACEMCACYQRILNIGVQQRSTLSKVCYCKLRSIEEDTRPYSKMVQYTGVKSKLSKGQCTFSIMELKLPWDPDGLSMHEIGSRTNRISTGRIVKRVDHFKLGLLVEQTGKLTLGPLG